MPIKEKVSLEEVVDFLNEILVLDPDSISAFFSTRVACNKKLADHPTVQVGVLGKDYYIFGALGILNGLFGTDETGWGWIAAVTEGPKVEKFIILDNNHNKIKGGE